MVLAWYHAGNTDQVWIQNQEIVSGGIGGLGLIVLGSVLLLRDALLHGRALQGRSAERVAGSEEGSDWLEGRDPGAATGDGAQVATRSGRRSGRKVKAST